MPDITLNNKLSFGFSDSWRVADSTSEQYLLERIDDEDCQLQIREMKVTAKSPEQRQQLIMSALNTASPEQVAENVYWTKEPESKDDENHLQRWLVANATQGVDVSIVIVDVNVPLQSSLEREALYTQVEDAIRAVQTP